MTGISVGADPGVSRSAPGARRGLRPLLLIIGAVLVLASAYLFWLRDSSLVAVERVTVTGLTTRDAKRIEADLVTAARRRTTLNVSARDLERAVERHPVVGSIEAAPKLPHGLSIHVVERRPTAVLAAPDGARVPVAGDGTVLRGVAVEGTLPAVALAGSPPATRLTDAGALRRVRVGAAAPPALRGRLAEVTSDPRGDVVDVAGGPELVFGDHSRLSEKWTAAAAVLADPSSAGASYVDLRLPDRPAAGGLAVANPQAQP